ncbi:MAG: bifunctional folylpolyglutamate synthase/dihydrofolate synthase [Clostridia bacterium]|nr:bifunctional folylpolyglutamate synthase/dihydrofolate synthase [Clostridia bacterium]
MTYEDALSYIHNTLKFGVKPGLERIRELMDRLGGVQDGLRCVHIAGTNGKGSTATMISEALMAAGYKTGLFTSPYIVDFRERIQINGEYIEKSALVSAVKRVKAAADAMVSCGFEHPTEFELITAAAFLAFAEQKCDYVVLETGLGGRLDSTNVIKSPEVCVITSISMDHMNVLGDTIELIASEKAGIIKPGADTVLYADNPASAAEIIRRAAADAGSRCFSPDMGRLKIISEDITGSRFEYGGLLIRINFAGEHQIKNAATALCAIERLRARGARISDEDITRGFAAARIPARFEVIEGTLRVIIDGGHNEDGVKTLCASLDALGIERPTVIMGMLRDKAYEKCISMAASRAGAFIAVDIDNPRALGRSEVKAVAARYTAAYDAEKDGALALARSLTPPGGTILICGSLYLASELREAAIKMNKGG